MVASIGRGNTLKLEGVTNGAETKDQLELFEGKT
ncbi:hypothetical protein SCE1572_29275 [Sorangium cellulosum So0157-2]|uniref:Uncharacterized protein n=1 Tax=Sorangium cellulosum So0157-2 TaxID=1254432 RepID=S4Y141_SORCE|nr:hypothetical protein SCE1572_29275 [Sorangium cellulosum So0157-2]